MNNASILDIDTCTDLLTDAFFNDPLWCFFCPRETKRRNLLSRFFSHMLRMGFRFGKVYTTGECVKGLSVWLPPTHPIISFWDDIRTGGLKLLFQTPPRLLVTVMSMQDEINRAHKRLMGGPHYVLSLLAIKPEFQGRGLAGTLLRPMLAGIDSLGLPVYLETQNESNISMYEHFDFRVMKHLPFGNSGVTTFIMKRNASSDRSDDQGLV